MMERKPNWLWAAGGVLLLLVAFKFFPLSGTRLGTQPTRSGSVAAAPPGSMAIAIGDDADEPVLKKIANAAHGRFWKGQTVGDTVVAYKSIATYN